MIRLNRLLETAFVIEGCFLMAVAYKFMTLYNRNFR